MKLQEECLNCKGQLLAPQLKKSVENKKNVTGKGEQVDPRCTFCGKEIGDPKLRITIGKRAIRGNRKTYKSLAKSFLSASSLLTEIEHICLYPYKLKEKEQIGQLLLRELRKDHEHLFWNLVYYLNEYQLPFEFILPYESNV